MTAIKYTLPCVKQTAGGNLLYIAQGAHLVLCGDLERWKGWEVQIGEDICIHRHTTNRTLLYSRNQHFIKYLYPNFYFFHNF